jgi:hypothetical protein
MKNVISFLLVIAICCGCKDHDNQTPVEPPVPSQLELRRTEVVEWLNMMEEAGLKEYAELGRTMLSSSKIIFVRPPYLDAEFNAWADIGERRILINEPMWSRYPERLDRATILLHELIHVHSKEITHAGPWWSAQDDFRKYWGGK